MSDDPHGAIATALLVATTDENAPRASQELAPDGAGLRAVSFGAIRRVWSREDLDPPFDEDPTLDPETQERHVVRS